jgi:putative transposase
VGAR